MSSPVAFQGNAFQTNAFQSGYLLVAATYSLGSPSFASPALGTKYVLHANAYSLGSPSFAAPPLASFPSGSVYHLTANPWAVGSPIFGQPTLRQINVVPIQPPYSLGSPVFASPGFVQTQELFANTYILGGLDFAEPDYLHNYQLSTTTYDLGSPSFEPPQPPITVDVVFGVAAYWLDSPKFGYPRLQAFVKPHTYYPPTYLTQVNATTTMVNGLLDHLQASIPNVITVPANTVRALIFALRANLDTEVRGITLGTDLAEIYSAADAAGATYAGIEATRLYLVGQINQQSPLTLAVAVGALNMTLGLEANIISRMTFTTSDDAQTMLTHCAQMFDQAKQAAQLIDDPLTYEAVLALGGSLINHLASTAIHLPRFVAFDARMPLPSLYLAQRVFADPTRYLEIETENGVINPAFCPIRLRVLSNVRY